MLKIRKALISVWNKKGIAGLARSLNSLKIEIISTGKTATLLRKNGIPVKKVASLTSFPEILSGRVKTLHPKIFGGILANKKHPLHMEEISGLGIQPIDMVVVNLYPFPQKVKENLSWDEMIEYIDIGGPSMLRAAAKNFKNVACVSRPEDYKMVLSELEKNKGFISADTLKSLAQQAFYLTKEYDNAIYNYFKGKNIISWNLEESQRLRYGENPHQKGALYKNVEKPTLKYKQLQGKELSFNNFLDLDTAFSTVKEFNEAAACVVKHASICGAAIDKKLSSAYRKAYSCDPLSSFGGIVGLNRKVDKETSRQIVKSGFKECIVAPSYSKESLKIFSSRKKLRIIEADFSQRVNFKDVKSTNFGYLIQQRDIHKIDKTKFKVVTRKKPTPREFRDLIFAWKIAKHVKSNAIVIAKNYSILGIGGGQPSRVGAVKIALKGMDKKVKLPVLASDAFFPKEDAIKAACRKGVRAIIQPGGSIKDPDIVELCDKLGISMVFTGIRHFRH
ncbi:MAG: bifunctional phosphoribosylaminoimidazolecarboxamide formyltransferase/IMP cyclohydrolase [Candidatus Omnitrophica bacterium]|nr:bifunctional phosphoribosylaminoimidazolecarboxamide formyltransferase/IMP cyclohydrolase [Candidatus Omnitrophota bacterium]MBD3268979.1 bifunctional phosphoribosylaminoimidazolecarboxamide formyltransferase/IMP cyclohydrolase [Candidatus Omnitrophota bacterium]